MTDRERTVTPFVGMGVTVTLWAEREPGTITGIKHFKSGPRKDEPRSLTVRYGGSEVAFTFNRRLGQWVTAGSNGLGSRLTLGVREEGVDQEFWQRLSGRTLLP